MNPNYSDLVGITQEELESNFDEYIEELAKEEGKTKEETIEKIKDWYNGFRFSKADVKVYNPYSTLHLLGSRNFENYWFSSGTPTFLVDLIKERNYDFRDIGEFECDSNVFDTYEIENLNIKALLYQTGYVTIKDYSKNLESYILGYPNREVKKSFTEYLAEIATGVDRIELAKPIRQLVSSLKTRRHGAVF